MMIMHWIKRTGLAVNMKVYSGRGMGMWNWRCSSCKLTNLEIGKGIVLSLYLEL